MGMTLEQTARVASETGFAFERKGLRRLIFEIPTKRYRNLAGERSLHIVLELAEDGDYVIFSAPRAYEISESTIAAFVRACMIIQWRTKLLKFDYDSTDGEIRPMIEFPLADAKLSSRQIGRCLRGMAVILDEYHLTLQKALSDGLLQFPDEYVDSDIHRIRQRLEQLRTRKADPPT